MAGLAVFSLGSRNHHPAHRGCHHHARRAGVRAACGERGAAQGLAARPRPVPPGKRRRRDHQRGTQLDPARPLGRVRGLRAVGCCPASEPVGTCCARGTCSSRTNRRCSPGARRPARLCQPVRACTSAGRRGSACPARAWSGRPWKPRACQAPRGELVGAEVAVTGIGAVVVCRTRTVEACRARSSLGLGGPDRDRGRQAGDHQAERDERGGADPGGAAPRRTQGDRKREHASARVLFLGRLRS